MRTYILTMADTTIPQYDMVQQKTERAIASCKHFGYDYEVIFGPTPNSGMLEVASALGVTPENYNATDCCNMSHMIGYNRIAESGKAGVIMEYDGYWYQPLPDHFTPVGCTVYNISRSNRGEGFILTPESAKFFADFRRSQPVLYGITDHLVNMKQRFPRGVFGKPKYQALQEAHHHVHMPGHVMGNENGKGDKYCESVRRLIDDKLDSTGHFG